MLTGIALALLVALLTAMLAWEMVHPPRHTLAWALARKIPSDPGEMGLNFEEWWLERPGGTRLAVWEIDCRGQRSQVRGQPAAGVGGLTGVFVHGWGHSRIDSLQRIEPFAPLVDRIVLFDLRGHGESTGGASRLGDGEEDDLLALLDRLDEGNNGSFLVVGHSMGAVIALRATTKARDQTSGVGQPPVNRRIAGVVLYAPYCEFHRSLQGRLRVNGLPSRPISDLALLVHRARGVKPASLDPKQLARLDLPLLVIHGVDDQVAPLDHARRIAEAVPGATLIEIGGAAHTDAHHIDETRHDDAVRAFVARLRAE